MARTYASRDMSLAERLDHHSEPRVSGRCQLWLGERIRGRYGRVRWRGRKILAHRATWECERGPIPEGMQVLHRCDNPPCRNIDHLFLGTNAENAADRDAKGRQIVLRGEAHGCAKLTEVQVIDIRAIQGVPQEVIAAMYGVSQRMVSLIRNRENWKHLEA